MKKLCIIAVIGLMLAACQESLEDRCEREAKAYTRKSCPMKIDRFTTLDSLVFERTTHTLHYYYTLDGEADSLGMLEQIDVEQLLRNELKNSTTVKQFKDNKYRFAYTYWSTKKPGERLYELVLTEKDYAEKR